MKGNFLWKKTGCRRWLPLLALPAGLALLMLLVPAAYAIGFTVNSTLDAGDANPGDGVCDDGSGHCTLRAAIEEANALTGSHTISLAVPGPYILVSGRQLTVTGQVTLNGNKQAISAGETSRVFEVTQTGNLSLNGVTIRDGVADAGGGISINGGTANIFNSAILSNRATVQGGGISNFQGRLNVANSTIAGNRANRHGGGIMQLAFFDGFSEANLTHVTITNNTADFDNSDGGEGGGIYTNSPAFNLKNSIVAGNSVGTTSAYPVEPDVINYGGLNTNGNNLIGVSDFTFLPPDEAMSNGDLVGTSSSPLDPQFGTLTGNPPYYPLLAGSPAIDHIDILSATYISGAGNHLFNNGAPIATDQPGTARAEGKKHDIGAVEALGTVYNVTNNKAWTPGIAVPAKARTGGDIHLPFITSNYQSAHPRTQSGDDEQ